jgi:acetyl esterase/lipase
VRDAFENRARVYSSAWSIQEEGGTRVIGKKGPLLVVVHAGGFCIGVLEHVGREYREFVLEYRGEGGVAVSISHRRAPEAGFPVPAEDCFDAVVWVSRVLSKEGDFWVLRLKREADLE